MDESLVARIDGRMYSSNELGEKVQCGKYVDRERGNQNQKSLEQWMAAYLCHFGLGQTSPPESLR